VRWEVENMPSVLLFVGASVIFLWGVGHLIPTRGIVSGFGGLTTDNSHIITMEWVAEGLTLCFLGVIVLLATIIAGADSLATTIIARSCAGMLLVLATLSLFTGARTAVLPMKLCPLIKSVVAGLYIAATLL
jgi:maltodextrin utilization protein YvdJ